MDGLFVFRGRPVEETAAGEFFAAVLADELGHAWEEDFQVVALLAQVVEIAVEPVPVLMEEDPPQRVGADAVHPIGGRGVVADEVEAFRDDLVVAEDRADHGDFRVHVAEPD